MEPLAEQEYVPIPLQEWVYVLHPRPVLVVVAGSSLERYSAMPASWVTPVSRDPPIVAVAVAPKRYTYQMILEAKEFALCLLPADMLEAIDCLGSISGRNVRDKLAYCKLEKAKARRVKAPIIAGSLAVLECTLWKIVEAGDHNLVLGQIVEAYRQKDYNTCPQNKPIPLHMCKDYYTQPGKPQQA